LGRVAIVGGGVSGLACARILSREHSVELFEARPRPGGHANTVAVTLQGRRFDVETGFVVFNERAYPHFTRLLGELGVGWQDAPMTFSVSCRRTGIEYGGRSLSSLFAQRRNLLRPSFLRMLRDVLRFGREAPALLEPGGDDPDLVAYAASRGYSRGFVNLYLVPMAAAIWSADPADIARMPARTFAHFFANHGILDIREAPQWLTVSGGSSRYVEKLVEGLPGPVHTCSAVRKVTRGDDGWTLRLDEGTAGPFDDVVLAVHSNQALAMLDRPPAALREVLTAIRYQRNEVLLHTDERQMPRNRRAWSSWNYVVPRSPDANVFITYDMSDLQSLDSPSALLVSLNCGESVDPATVLHREVYDHPVLDRAAVEAQERHSEVSGRDGLHLCGAYWGYGFHEDGVESAVAVARRFGLEP
jgi:predicted NAD/FAD-binding protein